MERNYLHEALAIARGAQIAVEAPHVTAVVERMREQEAAGARPVRLLPLVTRETMACALCDVLRAEMGPEPGELFLRWLERAFEENPEVFNAVRCFFDRSHAALSGAVVAYMVLRAQAEVDALKSLHAQQTPEREEAPKLEPLTCDYCGAEVDGEPSIRKEYDAVYCCDSCEEEAARMAAGDEAFHLAYEEGEI